MRRCPRQTMFLAALVSAVVSLSGCSDDGSGDGTQPRAEASGSESPRSKILQPGRPGDPNETVGTDAVPEVAEANDADQVFMQMMVPHHAQALQMSELARVRSSDPQVQAIARRILSAQGPEIQSMTAWLDARGLDVPTSMAEVPGHEGMDPDHMAGMMGMLTEAELDRLEASRGPSFDRLFLAGMIRHHQGAVDMAGQEMVDGSETLALELAAEVAAGQQAEIGRMEDIQAQLR